MLAADHDAALRAGREVIDAQREELLRRDAAMLARYCDDVIVSLDGPRDIHNAIRNVPRAYERLAEGVAAVRTADPQLSVSGRCTVQRANFHALRATVRAALELGLQDRYAAL